MTDEAAPIVESGPARAPARHVVRLVLAEICFLIPALFAAWLVVTGILILPWQGDTTGLFRPAALLGQLGVAAILGVLAGGLHLRFRRLLRSTPMPADQRRQTLGVGLLIALAGAPMVYLILFDLFAAATFGD